MEENNNKEPLSLEDFGPEHLKKIHQIPEPIPLDVQKEYIKQSLSLNMLRKLEFSDAPMVLPSEQALFDKNEPEDHRRKVLSILAKSGSVESYRIIEDFLQIVPPGHLRQWALLAQLEARVGLFSELLNERQIAITSGLGGKDDKMRFMALLYTSELQPFENFQSDLLMKELRFQMEKEKSIIEDIKLGDNYLVVTFLAPIINSLKELFDKLIVECNQYGHFLADAFLVTNSEVIGSEEINKVLSTYAKHKENFSASKD